MSTNPGLEQHRHEPVSSEVAKLDDHEREHGLDRLRHSLHEKALMAASRAEGAAALAAHQAQSTATDVVGRVAVLEDFRKTVEGDIKEIRADVGGMKRTLDSMAARSPIQQGLYALTALVTLAYFGSLLYDRWILHLGAG